MSDATQYVRSLSNTIEDHMERIAKERNEMEEKTRMPRETLIYYDGQIDALERLHEALENELGNKRPEAAND